MERYNWDLKGMMGDRGVMIFMGLRVVRLSCLEIYLWTFEILVGLEWCVAEGRSVVVVVDWFDMLSCWYEI